LDFTALPSFVASRYFLISPSRHLLLRHDTFDFTEMLSFETPRYFHICTNSFRLNWGNTGLSRATSQHVIEIHAAVVASAAGRC
jgi:hypothetical protein